MTSLFRDRAKVMPSTRSLNHHGLSLNLRNFMAMALKLSMTLF